MLHPVLSPAFINKQLGKRAAAKLKGVELHVAYPNEKEQRRRDRILRHYCPAGKSLTCEHVTLQNAAVLLAMLKSAEAPKKKTKKGKHTKKGKDTSPTTTLSSPPAYDAERYDHLGQQLFFAEVRIVMDPVSKRDIQVGSFM